MSGNLSGRGSRVLVVGTAVCAGLPEVPAVPGTVRALRDTYVESCGMPAEHVRTLLDPATANDVITELEDVASEAGEVLLVHYVGHGVLDTTLGLHLATRQTSGSALRARSEAVQVSQIAEVLRAGAARWNVLILDCCFAGRVELTIPRGATLVAAARDEKALAPPGAAFTAFSGALVEALRDGIDDKPGRLLLRHVATHLGAVLTPSPELRANSGAEEVTLAPNHGYHPSGYARMPPEGDAEDCPYRGLARYTDADAQLFAGRTDMVGNLLAMLGDRLRTGGLTVVGGPSGSGKSSLLAAGLIPALRNAGLGGRALHHDHCVRFTPRDDPRAALEAAAGRLPAGGTGVIVVDQFEEIFAPEIPEAERRRFLAELDALAVPVAGRAPAALVVLGLRSDFDGHCARYPQLAAALERPTLMVGPMTTAELRSAIEDPARAKGFTLEPGLVDVLLRDAGADPAVGDYADYNPGVLPLLSQALLGTWQNRSGRQLTLDGYVAAGGVTGAIATAAEAVLATLDPEVRAAAATLLPRMVRWGTNGPETRRRIRLATVGDGAPAHVLAAFVAARLITVADEHAQFTHEALIRSWPRLGEWAEQDRARRLALQEVETAADLWTGAGRDPGHLYRAGRLAEARSRIGTPAPGDLSPEAAEFLAVSLGSERRGARIRRAVVAALVVLTLLASGAAALAVNRGNRLEDRVRSANAQTMAATATVEVAGRPALATKLALTAWRADPTSSAARNVLSGQYVAMRSVERVFDGLNERPITGLYSSADGGTTVLTDDEGFTVVTGLLGDAPAPWRIPRVYSGSFATVSPDGHWLVATGPGGALDRWDLVTRGEPVRLPGGPAGPDPVLAFTKDSGTLLLNDDSGNRRWSMAAPGRAPIAGPSLGPPPISEIWFTRDPDRVLLNRDVPSGNPRLETRSLSDGRLLRTFPAGSTAVGSGRWVLRCVDTVDLRRRTYATVVDAATGKRHAHQPEDPECYSQQSSTGGHLLTPGRRPGQPHVTSRVTSLAGGDVYDVVLPHISGADVLTDYSRDRTLDVIDRPGGAPVVLVAADTAVLRLAPLARNPLPAEGTAGWSDDGRYVVRRLRDDIEVYDPRTHRRVTGTRMPPRPARAKTYAVTSGDPWLAQLLDGSWTLTAYTVPGLDRGAALVIPGQDDTTGDLSIVPLGGDRHLISTGGELAVWDLRLGRRVVGPVRLWATDEQRRRFSSRTHVVRRPGHPDQFIAYTAGERVQLWTLGDGPPEMTPLDLTADGGDIVFDARGERLMHLTPGKLIETWHLERGERTGTPFTAAGYDHLVGATTDGYLVTTVETMSNMRELGLWDPVSRSLSGTLRLSWSEMAQDLGTVTVTGSEVELEGRGLMPSTLSVDATVWAATLCRALTGGFTEAERNRLPEGVEDADPCP